MRQNVIGLGMIQRLFLPKILLHIEGAILFAASVLLYSKLDGNWLFFALLFFVPDVSIIAYRFGSSVGAIIYNLIHAYLLPAILSAYGLLSANASALSLALIWFAHLGLDRTVGLGLKYPTQFKDTHLNRV